MDQLLSAGAAMGGLYLLLLFGACLGGVAGFRLYALRRREERERALREEWERELESAESAAPPPPPNSAPKNVYYIVEKKRTRPRAEYAEPREIKF